MQEKGRERARLVPEPRLPWEALLARLPGYVAKRYTKSTDHWKRLSNEQRAKGFLGLVSARKLCVDQVPVQKSWNFCLKSEKTNSDFGSKTAVCGEETHPRFRLE